MIDDASPTKIKVVNLMGQDVFEVITNQNTEGTENIDLSALQNGMYIVMVYNGTAISNFKLYLNK